MNIEIENLIKALEKLKEKGIETVQINGTLMCADDGNSIIATNQPQI